MLTNKTKSHELKDLAPEDQHVVIKAVDKTKDKHTQLLNLKPSENKAETGGLVRELHLAVGAKWRAPQYKALALYTLPHAQYSVGVAHRRVLQKARFIALVVPFGRRRHTQARFVAISNI